MFVGKSINEGSVQSLHAWKWRQWPWLPRISWMFYHLLYSLEWLCAHRVRSPKLRTWHALCTSYNDSCWISLASTRRNSLSIHGWNLTRLSDNENDFADNKHIFSRTGQTFKSASTHSFQNPAALLPAWQLLSLFPTAPGKLIWLAGCSA